MSVELQLGLVVVGVGLVVGLCFWMSTSAHIDLRLKAALVAGLVVHMFIIDYWDERVRPAVLLIATLLVMVVISAVACRSEASPVVRVTRGRYQLE